MRAAFACAVFALALPASALAGASQRVENSDRNLAWHSFLAGGKVDSAYVLAKQVVASQPQNVLWRTRLAKVSLWTHHPDSALDQYDWLVTHGHIRYLHRALSLAIAVGDSARTAQLYEIKLRRVPYSRGDWINAVNALREIGRSERAIALLKQADRNHPRAFYLRELAMLYHDAGEPEQEIAALRRLQARYGANPDTSLQIATLLYTRGHIQQAYRALRRARRHASPGDTAYWRTLGELAWLTQHYAQAKQALWILQRRGTNNADDLRRLVLIEQQAQPLKAFRIASQGWIRYHDPQMFLAMLAIAANRASPRLRARAFSQMGPQGPGALAAYPFFWTSLARHLLDRQDLTGAIAAYRHALAIDPASRDLRAGLLWLLIDGHAPRALARTLPTVARAAAHSPKLWTAVGASYEYLGNPERALAYFRAGYRQHRHDPLWLMSYADVLAQSARLREARDVRDAALTLLNQSPARQLAHDPAAPEQIAQLATYLAPGEPAARWARALAQKPESKGARRVVLAWSLSQSTDSLARWWMLRAYRHITPPQWASLAAALDGDEGPRLASAIGPRGQARPSRERAEAAKRLEWRPLATTLDFQTLAGAPRNASLRREFVETALPGADFAGGAARLLRADGLASLQVRADAAQWIDPANRLEERIRTAREWSYDSSQLASVPRWPRQASLHLRHLIGHGFASFALGARHGLATNLIASVGWRQRFSPHLQTRLSLQTGRQPTATVPLYLYGSETRASVETFLFPDAGEEIDANIWASHFTDQRGGGLGNGYGAEMRYIRHLPLANRDFSLVGSLRGEHFSPASRLPQTNYALLPAGQTPSVGFFVPPSYLSGCAGISFNQRYLSDYSAGLRPTAGASLCANSATGRGYRLSAGLAGSVLGPDHLALTVSLDQTGTSVSGRGLTLAVRYRYYLNP